MTWIIKPFFQGEATDQQTAAPSQTRQKNTHQELYTKQAVCLDGVAYRTAIDGSVYMALMN